MTARVITESYAHGQLAVAGPTVLGVAYVSVEAWEGGAEASTLLYLTPAEAIELVVAVRLALDEIGIDPAGVNLAEAIAERTQNPRPSASPVAEGRDTAAGPSELDPAEPGRPVYETGCTAALEHEHWTDELGTEWCPATAEHQTAPHAVRTQRHGRGPSAASPGSGRPINPIGPSPCAICGTQDHTERFHETGLSIAEITAARLAADPDSATVPFEAGGAQHVVDRCGCSDCETAFARQFARSVAAAEAEARAELLANSTLIGPAGGEVR